MSPAMCGRFLNKLPPAEIARLFATRNVAPNYPARFNIAPTDPVLAVRVHPRTGERSLDALRWGLVPHWAKDLSGGAKLINARAETLATTPSFREAFERRRCLIPASGFYEWRKDEKTRTPFAIVPADAPLFAFAGLWENWRDSSQGADAPWVRSCTIVTGEPNALLQPIHQRMPVILPPDAWARWLGEEAADPAALQALLRPYPAERMRLYPVSPRVNSVKNDDSDVAAPLERQSSAGGSVPGTIVPGDRESPHRAE
jgi:putative SOS response-associated peptidase YedK